MMMNKNNKNRHHRSPAKAVDNTERDLSRQEAKDLLWDVLGLLAVVFFLLYVFPFVI